MSTNLDNIIFYKRRIVRLLTPYLFLAVPYWIWRDIYLQQGNFFLDITMLSFPLEGVITTWYVGAIFFFYMIYPLIHKGLFCQNMFSNVIKNKNIFAILLSSFIAIVCFILMEICPHLYNNIEIGLTRLVIFTVGCKAGEWVYEKKSLNSEICLMSVVFLIFYILFFRTSVDLLGYWIRMSYVFVAISIVLLLTICFQRISWLPIHRLLSYFGNRSLEFYLSHVLMKNVYLEYFHNQFLIVGVFWITEL